MEEVKRYVEEEVKAVRLDIDTLKEENKEIEDKMKKIQKVIDELKASIELTDVTVKKNLGGVDKKAAGLWESPK